MLLFITVLFVMVIYSSPGIVLANLVWTNTASRTEKVIFGSVIGLAFSCYISVIVSYFVGWNPLIIIASIIALTVTGILLKRKFPNKSCIIGLSPWSKSEFLACSICVCFVGVFLYIVFSRVGLETEMGYRYSWLFGHDFINKAVNAVSLTHGVPPPHFFFAGEPLIYYVLSYSVAALAYTILGVNYSIHNIVILVSFLQALLFVFIIAQFFKSWFKPAIVYRLLVLSFGFYSFYGIFVILKGQLLDFGAPSMVLEFSGVSHLFYRFFLVEPQTVMGLMVFLVVLSLVVRTEFGSNIIPILITGLLIGIEFGIEPILGMILVFTYGLTFLYRLSFGKIKFKRFVSVVLGGAIPTIIVYSTYYLIGIYSLSGGDQGLNFALLNKFFLFILPIIALISFGPSTFFGFMGLISLFRKKAQNNADIVIIMGCLVIFFMITVSHESEKIFGYLKGEKILFIVLLVLSGFFFQWAEIWKQKTKKIVLVALSVVSIPALLTPFVDCYQASFTDKEGVSYVSYEDMEACDWIKRNLPKDAVVQSEPQYPGSKYAYSLIADFAERKMAVGEWKVAGVKHDKGNREIPERYHQIKENLFKTLSLEKAHSVAIHYGINYIYIGPHERKIYPKETMEKWGGNNELFRKVYDKNSIKIYKVLIR